MSLWREKLPISANQLQFALTIGQSTEPRGNLPKTVAFCFLRMLDTWLSVCCFFLVWKPPQHFCVGRVVTFQILQWKKRAWEEIYQKCSVQKLLMSS